MIPAVGSPRTHTPDVETVDEDGRQHGTFTLKRACNGCDAILGDLDNRDITDDGELTDVRAECPNCAPTKGTS